MSSKSGGKKQNPVFDEKRDVIHVGTLSLLRIAAVHKARASALAKYRRCAKPHFGSHSLISKTAAPSKQKRF